MNYFKGRNFHKIKFPEFREFGVFSRKLDSSKCNSRGCLRKGFFFVGGKWLNAIMCKCVMYLIYFNNCLVINIIPFSLSTCFEHVHYIMITWWLPHLLCSLNYCWYLLFQAINTVLYESLSIFRFFWLLIYVFN